MTIDRFTLLCARATFVPFHLSICTQTGNLIIFKLLMSRTCRQNTASKPLAACACSPIPHLFCLLQSSDNASDIPSFCSTNGVFFPVFSLTKRHSITGTQAHRTSLLPLLHHPRQHNRSPTLPLPLPLPLPIAHCPLPLASRFSLDTRLKPLAAPAVLERKPMPLAPFPALPPRESTSHVSSIMLVSQATEHPFLTALRTTFPLDILRQDTATRLHAFSPIHHLRLLTR